MKAHYLAVLALGAVLAADAPKDKDADAAKDLKALQGTWWATKIEGNGTAVAGEDVAKHSLVIKDNHYVLRIGEEDEEKGTFKLDPTKTPKAMDIKIESGEDKGKDQYCIYELDRDRLTICCAKPGEDRPTKPSAKKAGVTRFVFERAKP
jgi:uncharacterized protein (TIGR03067 family)